MQNKKKKRKVKKSRKPKVYIPPYKIIILCSIVIIICMALLLVTTIKSSENPQNSSIQNRYQQTEVAQNEKSSNKKNETPAQVEKKAEEKKEKIDSQKKIDNSKENSKKKQQDKQNSINTETSKSQKNEHNKSAKSENQISDKNEMAKENKSETNQAKKTPETEIKNETEIKKPEINENQNSAKSDNKKIQENKNQKVPENSKTQENKNQKKSETPEPAETQKNVKKADKLGFPQAKNHAQIIFVFDDGGQNLSHLEPFLQLPIPITIAVLPRLAHSVESAQKIRNAGKEVILHQPMQALNSKVNPGPGAITPQMSEDEIIATLFYNINEIGPVAGMNNHEGSAITADAEKMAVILKLANEEGIYFLDSRTNSETKVPYVANLMGYSYYERNIFLDNEKTKENALQELKKGLEIANKKGSVIMIGHIWSANFLPSFIMEVIPELQEKGYTFSTVSASNAQKF